MNRLQRTSSELESWQDHFRKKRAVKKILLTEPLELASRLPRAIFGTSLTSRSPSINWQMTPYGAWGTGKVIPTTISPLPEIFSGFSQNLSWPSEWVWRIYNSAVIQTLGRGVEMLGRDSGQISCIPICPFCPPFNLQLWRATIPWIFLALQNMAVSIWNGHNLFFQTCLCAFS